MAEEEKNVEMSSGFDTGMTDLNLAAIINNDKFKNCKRGCNDKAIFYCNKGCTELNTYCLICIGLHNHAPLKITIFIEEKVKIWNSLFQNL